MSISRRLFLLGSLSGAGVLVLSGCTDPAPAPSATATRAPSPSPSPTPSGPAPAAFRRSRWGADTYSYGSSSYLAAGATDADRAALGASLDDKVFFAGEAVAASQPGTVMGAHSSGLTAAAEVAAVAAPGERIAVIGAGMAGATAARTLADQGYDVVVIEARGRVGGRIASYDSDDWPIEVQLGVGTLTGDGAAAFESLLASAGVTTVEVEATATARIAGRETPLPTSTAVSEALDTAAAWAAEHAGEESVQDAVASSGASARLDTRPDSSGVSDADRLAFLLDEALPARVGAAATKVSSRVLGDEILPGSGQLVTGGFGDYVTDQLRDLDVLRSSNVTQIDYGNEGVGLRLVTGESLSADRVVSTIPLGVLKKRRIVFVPALPSTHLDAIDALGMGVQDVLWLRFDQRLWSTDATVWAVLDESAAYRLWLNLEPATGFPILVALTGGRTATALEKLSDSDAVDAAVRSIAPYFDLVPSTASPTPTPGAGSSPTPTP